MTSMEAAASLFGPPDSNSDFFATPEGESDTINSPSLVKKNEELVAAPETDSLFNESGKGGVVSDLFSGSEDLFFSSQDDKGAKTEQRNALQKDVNDQGDQVGGNDGRLRCDSGEGEYDLYSAGWYDEHNQWHPYDETTVNTTTADPCATNAPHSTSLNSTQPSQSPYGYLDPTHDLQSAPRTSLYGSQPSSPYIHSSTSTQSTYHTYAPSTASVNYTPYANSYNSITGSSSYSPYNPPLNSDQPTTYSVATGNSPYGPNRPLTEDSHSTVPQAFTAMGPHGSLIPTPASAQSLKTPSVPYRPTTSNAYDPPLPTKKPKKMANTNVVRSPASPFTAITSPFPPPPIPTRSGLSPPSGNIVLLPGPPPRSSISKSPPTNYSPSPYSQSLSGIPRAGSPYNPPSTQYQVQPNTYPSHSAYVPSNDSRTDNYASPQQPVSTVHATPSVTKETDDYDKHNTLAEELVSWGNYPSADMNNNLSLDQKFVETQAGHETNSMFKADAGSSHVGYVSSGQPAEPSRPGSPYAPSSPKKSQRPNLMDSGTRTSSDKLQHSGESHRASSPFSDSGLSQTGSVGKRTHSRKSSSQTGQSFSALDEGGKHNDPYSYISRTSLERAGSPGALSVGSGFGVPPPSLVANNYAAQDQNVVDLTRDTPSPVMPRPNTLSLDKPSDAVVFDPYKPLSQQASMISPERPSASSSNSYSPSNQYAPPRSSLDQLSPPRERSMSNLSTFSTASNQAYDLYAPSNSASKRHNLPSSPEKSYENGQSASLHGSYANVVGRSSFESTYSVPPVSGPYAPSPSLLGTNDPLGRASTKVPVISFGFGGKLITCFHSPPTLSTGFDVALSSRKCTDVYVRPLHKLIPETAFDSSLATYPGPLFGDPGSPITTLVRTTTSSNAKTKNKKARVLAYLGERTKEIESGLGYLTAGSVERREADGKLILVRLLRVLVEHDGQLHGNSSAEAAARAAVLPRLNDSQNDSETNAFLNTPTGADLATGLSGFSNPNEKPIEEYAVRPSSLKTLQGFLLRGEKRKAYHYALDEKLWAHAMVISSSLDKEAFKEVVSEFIRSELGMKTGSRLDGPCTNGWESLRLAYSLFSGQASSAVQHLFPTKSLQAGPSLTLQPPTPMNHMTPLSPNFPNPSQASNIPADILSQWQEYAVMLFSGQMGAESSSALTTLGDYLISNNWVEAAHCCYLLSPQTSPIGGVGLPSVRIVLVGSHSPHRNPLFFLNPDNFILSEILEFALSLHTPTKGQEAFPGFPHLQTYRLIRALQLAEMGHIQLAKRYCESITSTSSRPSPYLSSLFSEQLKELYNRINGDPEIEKAGSWISGKIAKPSLDGLGDWIGGTLTKFVAGEPEPSSPRGEHPLSNNPAYSGTFSHYSNISSANTSRVSSPAPSFTNGNAHPSATPARSGSAMAVRSMTMSQIPMNRASSAMGYDRIETRPESNMHRVSSASAGTTSFNQSRSFSSSGYGHPGSNSINEGQASDKDGMRKDEDQHQQEDSGWWSSAYTNGRTPTASSFVKVDSAVTESGSGFISLMDSYSPFTPSPALSAAPSQREELAEEFDDDLGLGNSSKEKADIDVAESKKKLEKKEEKKEDAVKPEQKLAIGTTWLGRWFSRSSTPTATKAHLGEETSFYYDKELKRWVNKRAGAEPAKPALPPPPPSRAQTASPSKAMQNSTSNIPPPSPLPPRRPLSAMDASSGPPPSARPMQRARSSLIPEEPAGNLDQVPAVMAPLTAPPPTGRPKSAAKKSVRSRYVDVFQQPPS